VSDFGTAIIVRRRPENNCAKNGARAYLRQAGIVDEAEAVSMGFAGNTALRSVPRQIRPLADDAGMSVVEIWNTGLRGVPPMRDWTVEQLMAQVDEFAGVDQGWRDYLRERYGV
jgi:hypothetical protein